MEASKPTCQHPLSWETLVAYWAGDLSTADEESAELHLMSCAACTAESQRVAGVTEAIRAGAPARPAFAVHQGGRADAPTPRPAAPTRRRWLLGGAAATALAAAAAVLLLLPKAATDMTVRLPVPVRDAATVDVALLEDARDLRLEPTLPEGTTADGARLRRVDGGWITVRVQAGPPFTVVVPRRDLAPGLHQLELVSIKPEGGEEPRGVYRFRVTP